MVRCWPCSGPPGAPRKVSKPGARFHASLKSLVSPIALPSVLTAVSIPPDCPTFPKPAFFFPSQLSIIPPFLLSPLPSRLSSGPKLPPPLLPLPLPHLLSFRFPPSLPLPGSYPCEASPQPCLPATGFSTKRPPPVSVLALTSNSPSSSPWVVHLPDFSAKLGLRVLAVVGSLSAQLVSVSPPCAQTAGTVWVRAWVACRRACRAAPLSWLSRLASPPP